MKKENIYIRILRYGDAHPDGFLFLNLVKDLELSSLETNLIQYEMGQNRILRQVDTLPAEKAVLGDDRLLMLSFEDKSKLLQYEEMEQAKKSAKTALLIAVISITLSCFSVIRTSTVRIDDNQIHAILNDLGCLLNK